MSSLPLYEEHSCALGVVVMNYLDELDGQPEPTAKLSIDRQKHLACQWVMNGDFMSSFYEFGLMWNAVRTLLCCLTSSYAHSLLQVYAGVKVAGAEVADQEMWDETNEWLQLRR